jgi:hypothetical protein
MMILLFKNGKEIKISNDVADQIANRIISQEGAKPWQIFGNDNAVNYNLVINLSDVSCIYSSENIL